MTQNQNPAEESLESAHSMLEIEFNELRKAWQSFQDALPVKDRLVIDKPQQGVADVVQELSHSMRVWSSSPARFRFRASLNLADKCIATIKSHDVLMRELPSPKDHGSLFYSVLRSIIFASRDYYRVAEGFLTCLEQINNAVLKVTKSPPKSETERGRNVAALYSHIYLFLGRFMDFYLGRTVCRLLYSHNENFYQNFRITAQTIADAADGISKGQSPDFVYRNTILKRVRCRELPRLTGLEGSLRDATSQTVHVQQLIWDIQMSKEATQQLAASGTDRLYGLARTFTDPEESDSSDQMDNGDSPKESSVSLLSDHRSPPPTPSTSRRCLTRLSLLNASRDLQSFVDKDDQIEPVDLDTPPQIPPAISRALYEWTRDPQSGQLTVTVDESEFPECSRASIAAYYVWKARQEGIPVISHFCSPARHPKKIPGLIALVYSLIRQLLELAPPKLNFDGAWDLSGDRFQQLDGKIDTWNEALKILDMMMYFRPPLLLCVLDGLEVLESENTAQYIKPLILLLCGRHSPHQSMAKIHGVTKVLFTNSRHSQILQEALEEASTVVDAPLVDPDPPLYIETGKDGDVIMVDS